MRGMVDLALSRMRTAATSIAILLALAPIAAAEDLSAGDQQRHGGWVFEVTPYFWLPETHGTITVRDRSADLDIDFGDVFDLLGDGNLIGGMGHFEARKDRLALFVDSMGVVIDNAADGKILSATESTSTSRSISTWPSSSSELSIASSSMTGSYSKDSPARATPTSTLASSWIPTTAVEAQTPVSMW